MHSSKPVLATWLPKEVFGVVLLPEINMLAIRFWRLPSAGKLFLVPQPGVQCPVPVFELAALAQVVILEFLKRRAQVDAELSSQLPMRLLRLKTIWHLTGAFLGGAGRRDSAPALFLNYFLIYFL